jgi:hypothetical protein
MMGEEFNIINMVMDPRYDLVVTILKGFSRKQGFVGCEFSDINVEGMVFFDGQYGIMFSDILLDTEFNIPKGVAVSYMQGFSVDDDFIDKELSYKEYLESKKLI